MLVIVVLQRLLAEPVRSKANVDPLGGLLHLSLSKKKTIAIAFGFPQNIFSMFKEGGNSL